MLWPLPVGPGMKAAPRRRRERFAAEMARGSLRTLSCGGGDRRRQRAMTDDDGWTMDFYSVERPIATS